MTKADTPDVKVFFSYAHEDQDLRDKLEEHLSSLKRRGLISTWHDRKIGAGREWAGVIGEELEAADIILLLIGPAFINSDYCYGTEMNHAIKRHEDGQAIVIPVILRPVLWESAPFGKLQALPTDAKPVTKWRDRNEAFKDIANGIAKAAERIIDRNASPVSSGQVERGKERLGGQVDQLAKHDDAAVALLNMRFRLIQPGTFLMGSSHGEENEKPIHEVTISRPFYMGMYVVTQGEWRSVMGTEPWKNRDFVINRDDHPAVYVSWVDAKAFISKLNSIDSGNYYRLPTEAEWEYAARAGTTTRFSFGDDERLFNAYGWYKANSYDAGITHPHAVGQKRPNPWELYDMHGNIWEWVEDWYYGSYEAPPRPDPDEKVVRGGGYDYSANGARSAFRNHLSSIRSNHVIGFRLVKEPL
jgi:formylglycine-generating enzyme required for sulfatase activity